MQGKRKLIVFNYREFDFVFQFYWFGLEMDKSFRNES